MRNAHWIRIADICTANLNPAFNGTSETAGHLLLVITCKILIPLAQVKAFMPSFELARLRRPNVSIQNAKFSGSR